MKALLPFALLAVLTGCGDPPSKLNSNPNSTTTTNNMTTQTSCVFDADCNDGEACEAALCVATCASSADCAAGEFCGPGLNTELMVCQTDGPTNINPNNINPNNISPNVNVGLYYVVQIQSTTTAVDACATADPGPDIFGVALESTSGSTLGWGIVVWDAISFGGNDQTDTSVLDGNGPDLSSDVCPDMFDGNVVSLGCDEESYILVQFVDPDSQPLALDAAGDQVIRVYEWGGQCTTGSIDDTYNVSICTDTAGTLSGDPSSCTIQVIIDGSGESSGEVGGF